MPLSHLSRPTLTPTSLPLSIHPSVLYGISHLPERISNIGFDRESRELGESSNSLYLLVPAYLAEIASSQEDKIKLTVQVKVGPLSPVQCSLL